MKETTKRLYGFTLVETLITTIIIGILVGVIFEVFVVIGHIAVYIQQQKQIHNEIIYVTQTIQNLVDDEAVVMSGYDSFSLESTNGFVDELLLSSEIAQEKYSFTRECDGDDCYITLTTEPFVFIPGVDELTTTRLTTAANVNIALLKFKILPFQQITSNDPAAFEKTMHQGFWMFIDARSPLYDEDKRRYRIYYQGQLFFNPRKY